MATYFAPGGKVTRCRGGETLPRNQFRKAGAPYAAKLPVYSSAFLAAVVFFAVLLAAVVFFAVVLAEAVFLAAVFVVFLAVEVLEAVFFAVAFLAEGFFSSAATVSAAASPPSAAASVFFRQPPRFYSGVKLEQASLMQKGFLNPRPDFLNIVQPHTGQLSFTGTSQVIKSQRLDSSLLLTFSQQ